MAFVIGDACVACGACEAQCPDVYKRQTLDPLLCQAVRLKPASAPRMLQAAG